MKRQTDYRPPSGRPGWSCPKEEQLDLLYLAWGWRRYRETPQYSTTREGWLYFMPKKGTPRLMLQNRALPLNREDIVILHPDCQAGWDDLPEATSEVCTWVWRSSSRWAAIQPPPGGFLRFRLPLADARSVRDLHELTRREIQHSDEHTKAALEILRLRLDLTLCRSQSGRFQPAPDGQRLELACRWIQEHLENHNAVSGLCDYLQLSASTLNRLFQRRLKMNARAYAKQARIARARVLIGNEGKSVKEAAYVLGYRFPNDLSRVLSASYLQE